MPTKDFLIVALDFPNFASAKNFIDQLDDEVSFYKVGMQLFYAEGFKTLEYLKSKNKKIFLDLKLNDIPATIGSAVQSLSTWDVDYLTLFTEREQLEAAHEALTKSNSKLKILNVTVLTSSGEGNALAQVLQRAGLSRAAQADGIICSGLETRAVRELVGSDFVIINPGIRRQSDSMGDQKRVVVPRFALSEGASHIVVGRPISQAQDPLLAAKEIWAELL